MIRRERWLLALAALLSFSLLFLLRPIDPFTSGDVLTVAGPAPSPPRFAYLISGSAGDASRLKRLLAAVYHPWNFYLLHLDRSADSMERADLARFVEMDGAIGRLGNAWVEEAADQVTYKGPTAMASVLHGVAVLLLKAKEWDWFINLSAGDYPLMPQDDLLHIFSYLPRELNFIEHTSEIGWKEYQSVRPIIVDPGLYDSSKTDVLWAKDRRTIPSSFKLFAGSSSVVLTRSFLEFCIWGWDNLPRILLMYYTNFFGSMEGYFHTVICNSQDFHNTTVNHDMRFMLWDNPPGQHPHNLTLKDFDLMVSSGAPFASTFLMDDPVLDRIDLNLLKRTSGKLHPYDWCQGNWKVGGNACSSHVRASIIRPHASSKRLENFLVNLLDPESFRLGQCK